MLKVIVPTLNAAKDWPCFAPALLGSVRPEQVLIIDSESTDNTLDLAGEAGFEFFSVARAKFNHGGTRQMAAEMSPCAEILVYMTQDAVLAEPDALAKLQAAFDDPNVGAVYGRQLPRRGAEAIEIHARNFNYPALSQSRSLRSREQLGIKTVFLSNSLAAYRRSALLEVGGFPTNVIFGEDTITAARMLLAGYKIEYIAEARAYHSHSYTWVEEFKRYFDIGVLHSREHWLLEEFGQASGEGTRFLRSELAYLWRNDAIQIPAALTRTFGKLLGYRLGRIEKRLSIDAKKQLSMHSKFWTHPSSSDSKFHLR